jgi:hypothetical protein
MMCPLLPEENPEENKFSTLVSDIGYCVNFSFSIITSALFGPVDKLPVTDWRGSASAP